MRPHTFGEVVAPLPLQQQRGLLQAPNRLCQHDHRFALSNLQLPKQDVHTMAGTTLTHFPRHLSSNGCQARLWNSHLHRYLNTLTL
jgi:hypothetical protein